MHKWIFNPKAKILLHKLFCKFTKKVRISISLLMLNKITTHQFSQSNWIRYLHQLLAVLPRNSEVSEFHRNCLKPSHPGFSSGLIANWYCAGPLESFALSLLAIFISFGCWRWNSRDQFGAQPTFSWRINRNRDFEIVTFKNAFAVADF